MLADQKLIDGKKTIIFLINCKILSSTINLLIERSINNNIKFLQNYKIKTPRYEKFKNLIRIEIIDEINITAGVLSTNTSP